MEKSSLLNCVSVNLSKCDNLIKKRDGPLVDGDAEANNIFFQKPHVEVPSTSMKMNPPPSKTMSIKDVFHLAITEAKNENPKEFCLPAEYLTNSNLNVTIQERDSDGLLNDMDSNNDIVEPARQCYYCKRTSDGEIINCHFCPGSFHINCLNPPLCCVPDVKWMCPLHPHHILDKIMNRSCSVTQLSFWANKVAAPTNDKSVEIDFIEKTKQLRKEQSKKIFKCSTKIPDIIKYHYKHPSSEASLLDLLNESNNPKRDCFRNELIQGSHRNSLGNWSRFKEKKNGYEEWNTNTARNDHPRNGTLIEIVNDDNFPPNVDPCAPEKCKSTTSEDFSLWDKENRKFKFKSCGIYEYDRPGAEFSSTNRSSDPKLISVDGSFYPTPVESKSFNSKKLSWKRIQQILDHGIENSFIDEMPMSFGNELASAFKERLKRFKFHSTIRNYPPSFAPKTFPYPFLNTLLLEKPLKKTRAVLCPLSHHAPPVFMYHNTLNIGTDIFNDVYLTNYGNCNFLSKNHATIFYDEFTKTYELLNYSEYNCVVDGVCYTNDLSARTCNSYFKRKRNENEVDPNLYQVVNRKVIPKRKIAKTFNYIGKRRLVASSNHNEPADKKRFNSSISRERESRYVHKRLLQDIEKLVTKSQKEMNVIADEDLNEISKILKAKKPCPPALINEEIQHKENPHTVFIIKRKRKSFPNLTADRSFFNRNRKIIRKKGARNMPYEGRPVQIQEKAPQYSVMDSSNQKKLVSNAKKDEEIKSTIQSSLSINSQSSDLGELVNQSFYHCDDNETNLLRREEKCKCRALNLKMPVGHDSSWEISASLHHGSHIRFGCIEFVFCIVDHPPSFEERSYVRERESPAPVEASKSSSCEEITAERMPKNEDLSSKLTSILSVLSSESEVGDESSSYSLPVMINASPDFGERYEIDKTGSVFGSERVSNEETSSMSSDAVSILSDFHHSEDSENQGKKKQ